MHLEFPMSYAISCLFNSSFNSLYLTDLMNYLRNTFNLLSDLPDSEVAKTGCKAACQHTSFSMLEMLMKIDSESISQPALEQLNLDLITTESFFSSEIVCRLLNQPGSGAMGLPVVTTVLDELHQTVDLFLEWDWTGYLQDYGKSSSRYARVNPTTALNLLEKMADEKSKNTGSSVFASLSMKKQSKKQKEKEQVVRQLKELIGDWSRLCVPNNMNSGSILSENEESGMSSPSGNVVSQFPQNLSSNNPFD